jgi:hypothetical protein
MTYEYRIEPVRFERTEQRAAAVLAAANGLGRDGWRLVCVDIAPRLAYNEQQLELLFERALA